MAVIDTAQTGNWSATSTWVGGVVPTLGDQVRLRLTHVVTLDVNASIGRITTIDGGSAFIQVNANNISLTLTDNEGIFNSSVSSAILRVLSPVTNFTLTGNILGGSGQNRPCITFGINATGTINGIIQISAGSLNATPVDLAVGAVVTINGIVYGRQGVNESSVTGTGTVILNGNAIANVGAAISVTNVRVNNGIVTASNTQVAISATTLQISGIINDQPNFSGVRCSKLVLDATGSFAWNTLDSNGNSKPLYTASQLTGYPIAADIRAGVTAGPNGEITGTLQPVVINTAQLATDLLTEMNTSNLTIAQGLRDGMGASAAAIAAVGSINVIP
jgi:hypothetical protein